MPNHKDLRTAVILGRKAMGVVEELSELTGENPNTVLANALEYYKAIKEWERKGYVPGMVKDGKAVLIRRKS